MEWQECDNLTRDDYDKRICQFKNRFDLLYFLMNTSLRITCNGWYYCYCEEVDKCSMGRIPRIYDGSKKNIGKKCLTKNF